MNEQENQPLDPIEAGAQKPEDQVPPPPLGNVRQDYKIFDNSKPFDPNRPTIWLTSDTLARQKELAQSIPNIEAAETEQTAEWNRAVDMSAFSYPRRDIFEDTLTRPESEFVQAVDSPAGKLGIMRPNFSNTGGNNTKLTGEAGVLQVRALMGLGTIFRVPLWHSGFWITLKAPTEASLLELYRRIGAEKITLGRETHGLIFSNGSSYYTAILVDFILRHTYTSGLKEAASVEQLRSKISSLDIPVLVWGMACTIFTQGFQYIRPLIDKEGVEYKTIKEMLNISKMHFTDYRSLTEWQIALMGAGKNSANVTDDALKRYREEFTRGRGRQVIIAPKIENAPSIKLNLRVPSIDQYIQAGDRWVSGIVEMVDNALSLPNDDLQRDRYVTLQGRATNLRQYSHWVESIAIGDPDSSDNDRFIEDQETLEQTLDVLTADDDIRRKYFEEIVQFIQDSTISVIGVPAVEDGRSADESILPKFPRLLPIDPLSVFFVLLVQIDSSIASR